MVETWRTDWEEGKARVWGTLAEDAVFGACPFVSVRGAETSCQGEFPAIPGWLSDPIVSILHAKLLLDKIICDTAARASRRTGFSHRFQKLVIRV